MTAANWKETTKPQPVKRSYYGTYGRQSCIIKTLDDKVVDIKCYKTTYAGNEAVGLSATSSYTLIGGGDTLEEAKKAAEDSMKANHEEAEAE